MHNCPYTISYIGGIYSPPPESGPHTPLRLLSLSASSLAALPLPPGRYFDGSCPGPAACSIAIRKLKNALPVNYSRTGRALILQVPSDWYFVVVQRISQKIYHG